MKIQDEGIALLLSREITAEGKSTCRINGMPATAAVLRMKDSVMETANLVQENCGDILADAKDINEARAAAAEQVVDAAEPAE